LADAVSLARRQDAFLGSHARTPVGDVEPAKRGASAYPNAYEVAALRESHAQAYAPWTEAEESDLKRRHHAGETVDAIAAQLGRKPGAIRSRLKKLALI
jgi:hypothetical protein